MEKRSFLLELAHNVKVMDRHTWAYNEVMQLNVAKGNSGKFIPVCVLSSIITTSKAETAPGDEDPDPDADFIY